MPRADVPRQRAALCRSVATALHLAGVRALARVRADVCLQDVSMRRSVATALHLAGVRALARVRTDVRLQVAVAAATAAAGLLVVVLLVVVVLVLCLLPPFSIKSSNRFKARPTSQFPPIQLATYNVSYSHSASK